MKINALAISRRNVLGRNVGLVKRVAICLSSNGVSPNSVSLASIGFALLGAAGIYLLGSVATLSPLWLGLALFGILLRCLCNLWDGLIAIEGGKASNDGAFYNEVPDRIADVILLVAAGLAWQSDAVGGLLGVSIAMLAVTVAYVRAVGGRLCNDDDFSGPMSKPIRMGVLALSLVAFPIFGNTALLVGMLVIGAGCLITIATRSWRILTLLR